MNPKPGANLRKVLADLYPDEASIRRIAADAGLDLSRAALTSSPINNWQAVWNEAAKTGHIDALLEVVESEYGDKNSAFRNALNAYRQAQVQAADSAGTEEPTDPFLRYFHQVVQRIKTLTVPILLAAILEVPIGWFYWGYKDRFLPLPLLYILVALLTVVIAWGWSKVWQVASHHSTVEWRAFTFAASFTVVWGGLISYQLWDVYFLQRFAPDKFGIAVAIFSEGASHGITDSGKDIQHRVADNLNVTVNSAKIAERVEIKPIGLIQDTQEAADEGNRLGAKIVLWGQILEKSNLENNNGVEIHFQVLDTALFMEDPVFPRVMPMIDSSLHLCVGLGQIDPKAVSQEILGLATYSIGLYYYLKEPNPKIAVKEFTMALNALTAVEDKAKLSNNLLCGDQKANLSLAYYYLGKSYQLQGQYQQSLAMFDQARKQQPADQPADSAILLGQAYSYGALGQEQEKLKVLDAILQQERQDSPGDTFNRALAYEAKEDDPSARLEYQKMLASKPDFFIAYLNAAQVARRLNRLEEAQSLYQTAQKYIEGNPMREAWLRLGQGQLYEASNANKDAIQAYSQALAASSAFSFTLPYLYRARLYERAIGSDKACQAQVEPDAATKAARQDYLKVIENTEAISLYPGWAYAEYAGFLFRQGDCQQAIEEYKQALPFLSQRDPLIEANLAQTYAKIGDEENALKTFEVALQASGEVESSIRDFYGHALYDFGRIDEAIVQFKRSIELSQDPVAKAGTQLNLGQLYTQTGNAEAARALYQEMVDSKGQTPAQWLQEAQKRLNALPEK